MLNYVMSVQRTLCIIMYDECGDINKIILLGVCLFLFPPFKTNNNQSEIITMYVNLTFVYDLSAP